MYILIIYPGGFEIEQGSKEYCGRCIATPVVKLKDETYSHPEFPPTLTWHKLETQRDFQGSVLAVFELIEVSFLPLSCSSNIWNVGYELENNYIPTLDWR